MKKLFILLMAVMAFGVTARVTKKTYTTPANIAAWGTTADTLVLKVTSNYVGKMNLLLFTDAASGTPAYSAVLSGSINQIGWTALDTIAHTGGGDKTAYFELQDLKYNYYRIIITASGAAQESVLHLYGLSRY